jgi:mannose-6-phosphate isomerase-like protein (cupin superfamily)
MRHIGILLAAAAIALAGDAVDVYSAKDLAAMRQRLEQKRATFANADLARYGNHYTLLAVREGTGSAEVHQHEADIFVVESGEATLLSGGTVASPRVEKPGEIRGSSIQGGHKRQLAAGDIVHIPAGVPHQLLIDRGQTFAYFVIKVTGQ